MWHDVALRIYYFKYCFREINHDLRAVGSWHVTSPQNATAIDCCLFVCEVAT